MRSLENSQFKIPVPCPRQGYRISDSPGQYSCGIEAPEDVLADREHASGDAV